MATGKQTPMMRQYHRLKQQYKDTILLFRMGDFYETFGEDARVTSQVLSIALTTRDKKDDPTPLAGFPHHALEQYLPVLVNTGHHVAIAEQVEDPKLAKGIVKREITRIVTPGTLTEDAESDSTKNNFIISLFEQKSIYGIAICDASTGSLDITETSSTSQMIDEVMRNNPSEILIPPNGDFSRLSQYPLGIQEEYDYSHEQAKSLLTDHFNVKSLSGLGIASYKSATIAAAALLCYLADTQKSALTHISSIRYFDISGRMVLDAATITNLDLFSARGSESHGTSLFDILNKTKTAMGARTLRSWLLHPLLSKEDLERRLDRVEFFHSNPQALSQTEEILAHISDIERICGRIGLNRTNARDLVYLAESLTNAQLIRKHLKEEKSFTKIFKEISAVWPQISDVISLVGESIVDAPPLSITEGGIIKDGFDKKIDEVRENASGSKDWIQSLEVTERERTGIPSLKVRMNKVFGYYIEVTHTHKEKIPDDYERKQTLVNSERYITPELKEKEEIVLNAEEKLASLEYECFLELREKILKHLPAIQSAASVIAEIDATAGLATSARLNDFVRPTLHAIGEKNGIINIKGGRHPVVEQSVTEPFIQNDIALNRTDQRLIILTGPNMSGKSTYIRQAALIILMAQIGSFVPAESAEISIVDRIFTRVGASDDLAAGRSTFMVEMDEAATIIKNATQHSFIVLDEVGRGTSTYDGVSIAWAIAEYIHNTLGARCLFATHYHELLKLADNLDGVKNYNVAVLEENDTVIFLRKIEPGGTDRSYGIYVAEMAGLPDELIARAGEILNGFEQESMFGVKGETPKEKKKSQKQDEAKTQEHSPQLSFIDESKNGNIPNVFKELKGIDVNSITPIQALQILEKWKKRVGH